MLSFIKKYDIIIELLGVFVLAIIIALAAIRKYIELSTSISIYAVLIATTVLLVSIYEIKNRLRPWVMVNEIDINKTPNLEQEPTRFFVKNTGSIPASRMTYTAKLFFKENNDWVQDARARDWSLENRCTLFPNQVMVHQLAMAIIKTVAMHRDIKIIFTIKYSGILSKYMTTNSFCYYTPLQSWIICEPQGYS